MNSGVDNPVADLAAMQGAHGGTVPASEVEPVLCSRRRAAETFAMLPEIWCASFTPWWMAGRVQARLVAAGAASEPPLLIAGISFLLFLPLYVAAGYDAAAEPGTDLPAPTALVVIAVLALLLFWGVVAVLRARVRAARGGAPSLVVGDVLATIPWCCCCPCVGYAYELAKLDSHMTKPPGTATSPVREDFALPPPAPAAPRSVWTTGLCGCEPFTFTGDLPRIYCALTWPVFIIYRLWTRLGMGGLLRFVAVLAIQVVLPFILFIIGEAVHSRAVVNIAAFFWYFNVVSLALAAYIRCTVRTRYSISGTDCDDALNAIFCAPCVLAQAERELNVYNTNGSAAVAPDSLVLPPPEFLPPAPLPAAVAPMIPFKSQEMPGVF